MKNIFSPTQVKNKQENIGILVENGKQSKFRFLATE